MHPDLIERYSAPVPRYTSYPTAPHFHAGITPQTYARWLGEVADDATISLYLHIPYCDRLCRFCGCHTKHTLRYEPIVSVAAMETHVKYFQHTARAQEPGLRDVAPLVPEWLSFRLRMVLRPPAGRA